MEKNEVLERGIRDETPRKNGESLRILHFGRASLSLTHNEMQRFQREISPITLLLGISRQFFLLPKHKSEQGDTLLLRLNE